jgi:hypothetical protein
LRVTLLDVSSNSFTTTVWWLATVTPGEKEEQTIPASTALEEKAPLFTTSREIISGEHTRAACQVNGVGHSSPWVEEHALTV